jgi:PhnB protein
MPTDLTTYLSFDGTCEEAFKHYASVLGGEILMMMRYADAPPDAGMPQQQPETANRIMHARLKVGDRFLMGADAPPQYVSKPQGFCVSIQIDDPAEAESVFHALAQDGTTQMPIGPTFWAQRFGMCIDKFGTPWMVNCEKPSH